MLFDLGQLAVTRLVSLSLLLIATLWFPYSAKHNRFWTYRKPDNAKAVPPTFPYFLPLLGCLPVKYLWSPREFVSCPEYEITFSSYASLIAAAL